MSACTLSAELFLGAGGGSYLQFAIFILGNTTFANVLEQKNQVTCPSCM